MYMTTDCYILRCNGSSDSSGGSDSSGSTVGV